MGTRFLALVLSGTLALTAAHSQERQPRIDSVMTPVDRVLIVEALTKADSPLAKPYSQGAPLSWHLVPEVEAALKAFGTPEALDLVSRIEATRPGPRAELEPVDLPPRQKLTFEDGYRKTWAEMHGPTFAMTLSNSEVDVVRRALDKVAEEHEKNDGFDDYWMGRRQRVLEEMNQGGFGLFVGGPGGWEDRQEKTFPLTLPEITLIGIAVSRDRYREAPMEEPETPSLVARLMNLLSISAFAQYANPPKMVPRLDGLAENVDCYIENVAAIALFKRIEQAQPFFRGGAG